MAIQIGDNFTYKGAKPLDARLSSDTFSGLKDYPEATVYDGILAYAKDRKKFYTFSSDNQDDPELGKWREFTSAGIGISQTDFDSLKKTAEDNSAAITVLNGTGDGSVSKAVTDAINSVIASAPEDFDTLKEISDYIAAHKAEYAELLERLKGGTIDIAQEDIAATDTDPAGKKITITSGEKTAEFSLYNGRDGAKGDPGEKGDTGEAGPAPTVAVEDVAAADPNPAGKKITITSGESITDFTIYNGADGTIGKDGEKGEQGVSVQSAAINDQKELILTLSDNSEISAGKLPAALPDGGLTGQMIVKTDTGAEWQSVAQSITNSTKIPYETDDDANTVYTKISDLQKTVEGLQAGSGVEDAIDDKKYFRTKGAWSEFTGVSGTDYPITVRVQTSDVDYTPKQGELVYLSDKDVLGLGDGATKASSLTDIRGKDSALGYTPEDSANKGQPEGYAPLGADGKVPAANLPDSATSSYTQAEIDTKIKEGDDAVKLSITTEATDRIAAVKAVQDSLDAHIADAVPHITAEERDKWNAKVDSAALDDLNTHVQNSDIHVTLAEKNRWNGTVSAYMVKSQDEMAAIETADLSLGDVCYLRTSDDSAASITADRYVWYGADNGGWNKDTTEVSVVSVEWSGIKNGPSSSVFKIDYAADNGHEHTNKASLDYISEDAKGNFTYRGNPIGANVNFADTDSVLPDAGEENALYIVLKDSKYFSMPTLSVYRNGAYEVLGRSSQNQSMPVTKTRVLQRQVNGAKAGQVVLINVPKDTDYKFLPIEVLKAGAAGQEETLALIGNDSSLYELDSHLVEYKSGLKIGSKLWNLSQTSVSDAVYYELDMDLDNLKDITEIM